VELTSEQVYNFSEVFLKKNFDEPVETPEFHRNLWNLCLLDKKQVAIAAPRGHAKSTAITHAFTLAMILFRIKRYVIIVSDTEGQAIEFLGDIKRELQENLDLIEMFKIKKLVKDAEKNIIVQMEDGYKFRILALGSGQRVRGRKWGGTRPDLIVGDDLENDEMVENDESRKKFRGWFFKALVPCMSRSGHIRVVGTILHMDSLLMRLMNNKHWYSVLYKAHAGFDDFSDILWPEMWPETRLKELRDTLIEDGDPEGYSQEMLNDPMDQAQPFFRDEDFIPMSLADSEQNKLYYAGVDFAVSSSERADYTVMVVGGMDHRGILHIVDVIRFRGADDIVPTMIDLQQRYDIQIWKAEQGAIKHAIGPQLYQEMSVTGVGLDISDGIPAKDKRSRARPIQRMMRAGRVRFDAEASWYPALELEMRQFPKGVKKDQVDAIAWLGAGIKEFVEAESDTEQEDREWRDEMMLTFGYSGRNGTTGY